MTRRTLLLAAAALALPQHRADAQWAVACVNCSTVFQQMMEYATQLKGVALQAQQYARQGQMYANMVQNTASIPVWAFRSVQGDINAVRGIISQGSQISLNSGHAVGSLGSYAGYVGSAIDMPGKYESWSRQANDNVTALARGLGLMQDQNAARLAAYGDAQQQVRLSTGQVQAIQAHAQISAQAADELWLLRQATLAQAQFALNQAQMDQDRRNVAQAQLTQFMDVQPQAMAGGRRY
jgi:type IV secretion system protein TrbJ